MYSINYVPAESPKQKRPASVTVRTNESLKKKGKKRKKKLQVLHRSR